MDGTQRTTGSGPAGGVGTRDGAKGWDPPWEITVTVGLPPVSEVELGGLKDLCGGVNKINKTPYISHGAFLNSRQKCRR